MEITVGITPECRYTCRSFWPRLLRCSIYFLDVRLASDSEAEEKERRESPGGGGLEVRAGQEMFESRGRDVNIL